MILYLIEEAETIIANHKHGLVTFCDEAEAEEIMSSYPQAERGDKYFFIGRNCAPFREIFAEYVICDPVHMKGGALS